MTKEFMPSDSLAQQLVFFKQFRNLRGRPLWLSDLEEEVYQLRRYREAEYGYNPTVDCFASAPVREQLASAMRDNYHEKFGISAKEAIRPHSCPVSHDMYGFSSSGSCMAVFTISSGGNYRYDPILWFIDIANTTDKWDLLEPKRHLAICGFSSIGFKT